MSDRVNYITNFEDLDIVTFDGGVKKEFVVNYLDNILMRALCDLEGSQFYRAFDSAPNSFYGVAMPGPPPPHKRATQEMRQLVKAFTSDIYVTVDSASEHGALCFVGPSPASLPSDASSAHFCFPHATMRRWKVDHVMEMLHSFISYRLNLLASLQDRGTKLSIYQSIREWFYGLPRLIIRHYVLPHYPTLCVNIVKQHRKQGFMMARVMELHGWTPAVQECICGSTEPQFPPPPTTDSLPASTDPIEEEAHMPPPPLEESGESPNFNLDLTGSLDPSTFPEGADSPDILDWLTSELFNS